MEETCPHLGAPLSHAQLEDIEDSMAIGMFPDRYQEIQYADKQYAHGINTTLVSLEAKIVRTPEADGLQI
jgi:hypothetical protein